MELTETDIMQIIKLVNESDLDQLYLEVGDLKLSVSKSGPIELTKDQPQASLVSVSPMPDTAPPFPTGQKAGVLPDESTISNNSAVEEGLVLITAPLMGVFYSQPAPDAPPYVEVGKLVCADDTVGLIEVMKLFTSVKAGVHGSIARICVGGGQLVEYGQTLFLIKPHES